MAILARAIERELQGWFKTGDTLQTKTMIEIVGNPVAYVDVNNPTNAELLADILAQNADAGGWGTMVTLAGKTWRANEVGPPTLVYDTTISGIIIELYPLTAPDLAANLATIVSAVTQPANCWLSYAGGTVTAHGNGVTFTAGAAGAATVAWPAPTAPGSGLIADELVATDVLELHVV